MKPDGREKLVSYRMDKARQTLNEIDILY